MFCLRPASRLLLGGKPFYRKPGNIAKIFDN